MVHPASGRISRVPPYSRINPGGTSISPTGPLPSMVALSSGLRLFRYLLTPGHLCRGDTIDLTTPSVQRLQPWHTDGLGSSPFARRYLGNLMLMSCPPGTEMFQFSGFASNRLCVQRSMTSVSTRRVSPFGHPRIQACLAAPRGFSQPSTSFVAGRCQGIHRTPFVA